MFYNPKLKTIYRRDENFKVIPGEYTDPRFGLVKNWIATEKVDGTSVVLRWNAHDFPEFGGRTAKSHFADDRTEFLQVQLYSAQQAAMKIVDEFGIDSLSVYAEMYGPGIQSGGRYTDEYELRVFDMRVNDYWLDFHRVIDNCDRLGFESVPVMNNYFPLDEFDIVEMVRDGFVSCIAHDRDYLAEGIVARTDPLLYDNKGDRVMWKIKHSDFA